MVFLFVGAGIIATKLGQKSAMLIGSWGALISSVALILVWCFFDPTTFALPGDGRFTAWNIGSILLLVLSVLQGGFSNIASTIVIPMTADCADYETYRSGKYVPGLMGTLFSFIDKLISSLAPLVTSAMLVMIGFGETIPDVDTPYSTSLKVVGIISMYGLVIVGLICNVIAMKYYPLNKQKMEEIQGEIARIKAEAAVE